MNANLDRRDFSLVYESVNVETVLGLRAPKSLLAYIKKSFASHYPSVDLDVIKESSYFKEKTQTSSKQDADTQEPTKDESIVHHRYLQLVPDVRSLKTAADFEDQLQRQFTEPIGGLLAAVTDRQDGLKASIQISLQSCSSRRRRHGKKVAKVAAGWLAEHFPAGVDELAVWANGTWLQRLLVWFYWFFSRGELPADSDSKLSEHLYWATIELTVSAPKDKAVEATKRMGSLAASFTPFTTPGTITFRLGQKKRRFMLSAAELAAMWHPPVSETQTDAMQMPNVPYLPVQVDLPHASTEEGLLPLGMTVQGAPFLVGIRPQDRLHQMNIGKTGKGKSVLLENQAVSDMEEGRGVGVIDPHGDLIEDLLKLIPKSRTNDVILFEPNNPNSPRVSPLECNHPSQRDLVMENNLKAMMQVYGFDEKSAPRLIHILRNILLAIIDTPYATYLSIQPMLTDAQFRKRVLKHCTDKHVRSFWEDEVAKWTERYRQEAFPAILNKTGAFLANSNVRRFFGSVKSDVNFRELMDGSKDGKRKIVLCNLAKGQLGSSAAKFTGSMMMTGFQNEAMSRADRPKEKRIPFYLYVDEYATYINDSFQEILAEARKFQLYLSAVQQNCSQIEEVSPAIMEAMFSNVWTLTSFQVAQKDAQRLSEEFAGDVTAEQILRLPKYHAVVRTDIDGVPSRPFVVQTLPPKKPGKQHADPKVIRDRLAKRFGRK